MAKDMTAKEAFEFLNSGTVATADDIEQALRILENSEDSEYVGFARAMRQGGQEVKDALDNEGFRIDDDVDETRVLDNYEALARLSNSYSYDDFMQDREMSAIVGNVEVTDQGDVVSDQDRKNNLDLMFRGAKLKAEITLAEDEEFSKDPASRRDRFETEVKKIFFADLAMAACSSQMDKPTQEEQVVGSSAYKDYIARQSEKAQKIFRNLIDQGRKVKVEVDRIMTSVADATVSVENALRRWRSKASDLFHSGKERAGEALKKVAQSADLRKKQLEEKATSLWGQRYAIAKSVRGSLSDNAVKLIANTGATLTFAGALASGSALATAVGAYAVYHGASSWLWPVVAEYRKINRQRKEKGEAKKSFQETLAEAKKNIFGDKRRRQRYYITAGIQSALSVAGLTWAATSLNAYDVAQAGVDATQATAQGLKTVAVTKGTVRVARSSATSLAQVSDSVVAGVTAKTVEEKKEAKQTFWTAIIGGTIAGAMNYFSSSAQAHVPLEKNIAPEAPNRLATMPTDTIPAQQTTEVPVEKAFVAEKTVVEEVPAVEDVVAPTFPRTYSPDMGISEKEYTSLINSTEGSLTRSGSTLDIMYGNLTDEVMDKHFNGMTREQVMYSFNRLYGFKRRVYEGSLREIETMESSRLPMSMSKDQEIALGDLIKAHKGFDRQTLSNSLKGIFGDGLSQKNADSLLEYIHIHRQFNALEIPMSDEQKSEFFEFGAENLYADKKTFANGLKEIFGGDLSNKEIDKLFTFTTAHRRFYENAEEMEAMLGLLGCGNALTDEQGQAVRALLDHKDEILNSGNGSNYLTGLNLDKGCADDDGQWQKGAVRVRTPAPAPAPVQEPEVREPEATKPEMKNIPSEKAQLPAQKLAEKPNEIENVELPAEKKVAEEPIRVHKRLVTGQNQFTGEKEAESDQVLSDEQSRKIREKAGLPTTRIVESER